MTTIQSTLGLLQKYLTWRYSTFVWGDYEAAGLESFLNAACQDNRLLRGIPSEQIWVGVHLVRLMTTKWLQHHLTSGSSSWDITVLKLLGVVLLSGVSARLGDLSFN